MAQPTPEPAEPAVAMEIVHVTAPGGSAARCGATDGKVVRWEDVTDPLGVVDFTCGDCLLQAAGGREHMAGESV